MKYFSTFFNKENIEQEALNTQICVELQHNIMIHNIMILGSTKIFHRKTKRKTTRKTFTHYLQALFWGQILLNLQQIASKNIIIII